MKFLLLKLKQKGLSLMEIIVSTLLFALVLAGLSNLFITGKRYIIHTQSRMIAGEIGKVFLDPLQNDVRQDSWGSNCLSAQSGCPGAKTINKTTYTPTYSISDVGAGTTLRKVKLTVEWPKTQP